MSTILDVENLSLDFQIYHQRVEALRDVSFQIPKGKTTALVGESGSGKSSCCQAIMGLLPKNSQIKNGHILFYPHEEDHPINICDIPQDSKRMRYLRSEWMSMIFQEPMTSFSPLHTIGDQVSEAIRISQNISLKESLELTERMLGHVGFPYPQSMLRRYPFELSGGLRQRAMIAMALMCKPSLLIADEPSTALDVTIQAQILHLLQELQSEFHMAILLVTHDMGVVAHMADYVVVLYQGEVVEKGPVEEIFHNPQHPYLQALLHAVPHLNMDRSERLQPLHQIQMKKSSFFKAKKLDKIIKTHEPLLSIKKLNKSFTTRKKRGLFAPPTKFQVLFDVDLDVYPGETVGLVGESGCGKTTLSKMVMRASRPDSGQIHFNNGKDEFELQELSDQELRHYRQHIQYVFQDPLSALNPRRTIQETLTEPLVIYNIGTSASRRRHAEELIEMVGLTTHDLSRYPHHFSGGQRQRINIARSLALQPELLICDEPVSALDVSIQAQILNLLRDLQKELNLTYLFISHNLAVVRYIADRIAVMAQGRIVELAPSEKLFSNPLHPYTKLLMNCVLEAALDHEIDYDPMIDKLSSDPLTWDDPFRFQPDQDTLFYEAEENHFVRLCSGKEHLIQRVL